MLPVAQLIISLRAGTTLGAAGDVKLIKSSQSCSCPVVCDVLIAHVPNDRGALCAGQQMPLISLPNPRHAEFQVSTPRTLESIRSRPRSLERAPYQSSASRTQHHASCGAGNYPAANVMRVFASPLSDGKLSCALLSPSPSSCSARCFSSAEVMQCVFAPNCKERSVVACIVGNRKL
jgi:hypothetical protein